MNHKVIRPFIDKDSKNPYRKGDSFSHENDKRVAFLMDEGFLEEKNKPQPKKSTSNKKSSK